jgi:hypothetical protein
MTRGVIIEEGIPVPSSIREGAMDYNAIIDTLKIDQCATLPLDKRAAISNAFRRRNIKFVTRIKDGGTEFRIWRKS